MSIKFFWCWLERLVTDIQEIGKRPALTFSRRQANRA